MSTYAEQMEEKIKEESYKLGQAQQKANMGSIGGPYDGCSIRQSIYEMTKARLNGSLEAANRANKLAELLKLLDKNPEVARILDLLEEVNS